MFQRTVIDIADQHTTLFHLRKYAHGEIPLRLGSLRFLADLHRKMHEAASVSYFDLTGSRKGQELLRLSPGYSDNKYWHYYLGNRGPLEYSSVLRRHTLPIRASLATRIDIDADFSRAVGCKISPRPSLLLYPFGWSTCINFLITGSHDLLSLAEIIESFTDRKILQIEGAGGMRLEQVLAHISEGVRVDAFGGAQTGDFSTPDLLVVSTVIAKQRGFLSWKGLTAPQQNALKRLVRPIGPPSSHHLANHIDEIVGGNPSHNFIFRDTYGRFIWSERMLKPEQNNARDLRCYHNNTNLSLLQAWHHVGLLREAERYEGRVPRTLSLWIRESRQVLIEPPYRNVSLKRFLEESKVQQYLNQPGK